MNSSEKEAYLLNNVEFLLHDLKRLVIEELEKDYYLSQINGLIAYDNKFHQKISQNPNKNSKLNLKKEKDTLVSLRLTENKKFFGRILSGIMFTLNKDLNLVIFILPFPKNLKSILPEKMSSCIETAINKVFALDRYKYFRYRIVYAKL